MFPKAFVSPEAGSARSERPLRVTEGVLTRVPPREMEQREVTRERESRAAPIRQIQLVCQAVGVEDFLRVIVLDLGGVAEYLVICRLQQLLAAVV